MNERRAPMDQARPHAASPRDSRRPARRASAAEHDAELDLLKVSWAHRVTLYMDLTREGFLEPIDGIGRAVILGLRQCCDACAKPGHVPGFADDARIASP